MVPAPSIWQIALAKNLVGEDVGDVTDLSEIQRRADQELSKLFRTLERISNPNFEEQMICFCVAVIETSKTLSNLLEVAKKIRMADEEARDKLKEREESLRKRLDWANGELLAAYQDLDDVSKEAEYLKMAGEGRDADRRAADKSWEEVAVERVVLDGEWENLVEEQEILEFGNEQLEEMLAWFEASMQTLEERSNEVFAKEERVLELNDQQQLDLAKYDVMRMNFVKKAADLKIERREVRESRTALTKIRRLLEGFVVELAPHEALHQSESIDPQGWQRLAEAIKASFRSTKDHRLAAEKRLRDALAEHSKEDELYRGKADQLVALEQEVSKLTIEGEEWQRENAQLRGKVRELVSAAEEEEAAEEEAAAEEEEAATDEANREQFRIQWLLLQQGEKEAATRQRLMVNHEQALQTEKENVERERAKVNQLEQALHTEREGAAKNMNLRSEGESKDATIKELMWKLAFYEKNHPSRPRDRSTESMGPERKRRREDPEVGEIPSHEPESPKTPPPPRPLHRRPSQAPTPPGPQHSDSSTHRPLLSHLGSFKPPPPFETPLNSFTFTPPTPQPQPPIDGRITSTPLAAATSSSSHTSTLDKSTGSASAGAKPTTSSTSSSSSSSSPTVQATSQSSNPSSSQTSPMPSSSNPLKFGSASDSTTASKEAV